MRSKWFVGIPIFLCMFLLTGCWDSVEINKRHVVLEIAVDKNQEGGAIEPLDKDQRLKITYTIPDIGKLSGEDSLVEDVKTTIVTKSSTLATSIDQLESRSQNTVTFSHTKALVLGEELIKDENLFRATIDGMMRNMKIGRGTIILVAKGEAGAITTSPNVQNPILGLYVMKYFNNNERAVGKVRLQTVGNLIKELQTNGITTIPVVSFQELKDESSAEAGTDQGGTIEFGGAALIKDYEFVEWLGEEEVRGELFVKGLIKEVPIVIDYKNEYLTYNIEQQQSKIKFIEIEGNWETLIEMKVVGTITEYISLREQMIFDEASILEVSSLLEQEIIQQMNKAIDYSRDVNVDFLNLGLEFYRQHPKVAERYESQGSLYNQDKPIHIAIDLRINNTGILE